MIIEFELAMPGRSSWNGRWSGDGRQYLVYRTLTAKRCADLGITADGEGSWTHSFGDGWTARVTGRRVKKRRRSDGFAGYEWMVSSVLDHGEIRP